MKKGVDVSLHQGNINWNKVKAAGIDVAIIRVLKRGGYDDRFEANYAGAVAAGLKVGVYVYSYAKDAAYARTEADRCLKSIAGKNLDMPVWLDLEWGEQGKLGKAAVTEIAKTFMGALQAKGYTVGIYSGQYWHDKLIDWPALGSPDWWAARPNKKPVGAHTIYQYDWHGKIPGVPGDVDLDEVYKEYWQDGKYPRWVETESGDWKYEEEDGKFATGWRKIAEKGDPDAIHWYYFGEDELMRTGWFSIGTDWYYAEPKGHGLAGALYHSDENGIQTVWYV